MTKRTILIASMGPSSAVLTETVWGLAHQTEPVVPDKVAALAARDGADKGLVIESKG